MAPAMTDAEMEQYQEAILLAYKGFSLRDVYSFHCQKIGVKVNSGVVQALPTRVADFGSVAEMDCSTFHLGEAGVYPVLEVARAMWSLEVLRLGGAGLSNDSVALVCQVVESHPSIRTVDVSANRFVSTPSADMLLKLARSRPCLHSVLLAGTSVTRERVKRIDYVLQQNRARLDAAAALSHAVRYEAAVDALPAADRHHLRVPILLKPLHRHVREVVKHQIVLKQDGFALPLLLRCELNRAEQCFLSRDGGSGLLGHRKVCEALSEFLDFSVSQEDADIEFLFNRCDTNDDGFITKQQWFVVVRNVLSQQAEDVKTILVSQVERAYVDTASGDGIVSLAELAACVSAFCAVVGQQLMKGVEATARQILLSLHGASALDEDKIPLRKDTFIEALVTALCVHDASVRHSVVYGKRLIPATKPR
eukprot:TRINITY_DN39908_c0_g1_i1.p1 TRINITY_DN39908_c0_g1~~TRINITY_DN39908_c0_g1_i1.p1  ORF type:complete len:449 (+),score=127.55 TRINITY_DN39908_c0_g1_i1:83-1348(+)